MGKAYILSRSYYFTYVTLFLSSVLRIDKKSLDQISQAVSMNIWKFLTDHSDISGQLRRWFFSKTRKP